MYLSIYAEIFRDRGIIGGILGAIVGVLPSFLSVVLVEKIYALLFALIPLCIYYGYKLLKGKMNKVVIVLTVILSVLSVYMIEMLLLAYYMVSDYGLLISEAIQLVGASLLEPSVWTAMTMDALTSFLFVALGIWIAWGRISRTAGIYRGVSHGDHDRYAGTGDKRENYESFFPAG